MSETFFLHSVSPLSLSQIPAFLGPEILSSFDQKNALEEKVLSLPGGEEFAEEARTSFIEEGVRLFRKYGLKNWEDATPDFATEFNVTYQTRIGKLQQFLEEKSAPISNELFKKCTKCNVTSEVPLKLCSRCKKISYCSKECQTEDWKRHRSEECLPKK